MAGVRGGPFCFHDTIGNETGGCLGQKLEWNPPAEQFVGDDETNRWLKHEPHKPWSYGSV